MNTIITSVPTTIPSVIELTPAPEVVETKAGMNPKLKTCIIVGATTGGIAGGVIAYDRIRSKKMTRYAIQNGLTEVERAIDTLVESGCLPTDQKDGVMHAVKARAEAMFHEKDKRVPGLFGKNNVKANTRRAAVIMESLYKTARDHFASRELTEAVDQFDFIIDTFKKSIDAAVKSL